MDNTELNSFFYETSNQFWTDSSFPILGLEGKFMYFREEVNAYKTQLLKLDGYQLYRSKPTEQVVDLRNCHFELVNRGETGDGIRIQKNADSFEFFGPIAQWVESFKHFCIQRNFSDSYQVVTQIGKGNFAKVYKAIRKQNQEEVAVKVFDKSNVSNMVDRQALLTEINILRSLNHKGVVGLLETFESSNHIIIVQELLRGGTLYDNLKRLPPLSEEKACKIIDRLLETLEYIHSQGILHRDLKPENILLRKKGELEDLVIGDFGLADYHRKDGKYMFTRCGTPGYVAPEVLQDKLYDYKVDVYSIGVLLYIMMVGKPPFDGKNYDEVVYMNYIGDINYSEVEASPECLGVLQKMLDKNQIRRQNADEVRKHYWFKKWIKKQTCIIVKRTVRIERMDQASPTTSSPLTSDSLSTLNDNSPKMSERCRKTPRYNFFTKHKSNFNTSSKNKFQSKLSPI